jgi:alpha-L-arabinofuranosidase
MTGWMKIRTSIAQGELSIRDDDPFDPANPHYLRIHSEGKAHFGISNEGFRGIGVHEGETYDFSAQIRQQDGAPGLKINLVGGDGAMLASVSLTNFASHWEKVAAELHPKATDAKARLDVIMEGKGTVDCDLISLFPRHTWKDRPGGLRADMVQMLADMKPGFMRFPGGCIVEGAYLNLRYQWKNTILPVNDRKLLVNRWNYEFEHRPTPDYYQSFGLGFFEFFQLCEDIGAQPLPILNCGMACQFNSGELVPLAELQPYIQDALDLIEFANGPADSEWGARRAALGHPAPFHMKMMGVGNEQWGPQYLERYAAFANAGAWQWTPDLIWVDSLRVYGTPSYYVQQLFCRNRGDIVLPVELRGAEAPPSQMQRLYASAVRDGQTHEIILKVVNPAAAATAAEITVAGLSRIAPDAASVILAGASLSDVNSFDNPRNISPVASQFHPGGPRFQRVFPPHSLTVLRLKEE